MNIQIAEVKKVINCCIPVANVKESAEWYVKHLGCQYEGELTDDHTFLRLSSGPDLDLIRVDEVIQLSQNGWVIPSINFHCDDAKALHEYLKVNGIQVEEIVDHSWVGLSFEMYDLNGNKIIVWQANI
ncbi:MAG: VOC family protein [Bacillota bacterium]